MSDRLLRTDGPAPLPGWARTLARQWRHRPFVKFLGICVFMALFFALYFELLRNPRQPPFEMPLTALDHWIGFEPRSVWLYLSLWIYVGLVPALMPTLRLAMAYGAWAALMCAIGLFCFWLWPTAVPAQVHRLEPTVSLQAMVVLLRGVDAAGNACPSLHVGGAVFSAFWIRRLLRRAGAPGWLHGLNLAWVLAIAWSTMALRQHVLLDVLAGAVLGTVVAAAALRWGPALQRPGAAQGL